MAKCVWFSKKADGSPDVTAETAKELAEKLGVSTRTVQTMVWKQEHGVTKECRYGRTRTEEPEARRDMIWYRKGEDGEPEEWAESPTRLAEKLGVSESGIRQMVSRAETGKTKNGKYGRMDPAEFQEWKRDSDARKKSNVYCDRCAARLNPVKMTAFTVWKPHMTPVTYRICKDCINNFAKWMEEEQ